MGAVKLEDIRGKLYIPPPESHKGQNGKLLLIGGSKLFHSASLWALKVASRIVDMVYYASVPDNNEIVLSAKKEFHDGIVIKRDQIDDYIEEADCVLIGPGLPRDEGIEEGDDDTRKLTKRLLLSYQYKRWVIDGGSLQTMEPAWIPPHAILTPHRREFFRLFHDEVKDRLGAKGSEGEPPGSIIEEQAKKHNCSVVLKGQEDVICSPDECKIVKGGNAGMTKGGTGDVLAGLIAALYCKNEDFLSAIAGSWINKAAGDALFAKVGYYFNTSDLVDEIPRVMKQII